MVKTYTIKINIDDKGNKPLKEGFVGKNRQEHLITKIEQKIREIFPLSQGEINAYLSSLEEK